MPSWPEAAARRVASLAAAGWNLNRLPPDAFTADLSTDAARAHEIGRAQYPDERARPRGEPTSAISAASTTLPDAIERTFATDRWLLTGSGRGAESIVASLVRPGRRVLANEVYVSGRWWVERFGGAVAPLAGAATDDLDDLAYVQLTAPPACLAPGAGRPVALADFRAARGWVDRHAPHVPLVVDASRLWENAAATSTAVADLIELADVLVLSAGKDLGCRTGGLVVARDERWWPALVSAAAILEPDGGSLTTDEQDAIRRGLIAMDTPAPADRWHELDELARGLVGLGLPIHSWGAGSIFLDPLEWLPSVPADELPAQVLLDVIWLLTGWRGLGSTTDDVGVPPMVRLAVRGRGPALLERLPAVAAAAATLRHGLRPLPRDRTAPYRQPAAPVDPDEWPADHRANASPGRRTDTESAPGTAASTTWLVARGRAGVGPERAIADAWTRIAPGVGLVTDDPRLAALLDLLDPGAGPPPAGPPPAITVDPASWSPASTGAGADLCWSPAAGATPDGFIAVRADSPLAAPLDAGSLFTLGTWLTVERTRA